MSTGKKAGPKIQIITDGEMTGTDTITSSTVDMRYVDNLGIQLVWTDTPNGTFTIEGSIDESTWRAVTTSPASITAAGSASDHLININQWPFPFLRVKYVNSSSTGTLQAYVYGKGL